MKKGQAEIVGLVVIVLLLAIALFMLLSFRGEKNEERLVRDNTVANNILNALVNVNMPDYDEKQLRDVIKEKCFLADECDALKSRITVDIMQNKNVLGLNENRYSLRARLGNSEIILSGLPSCSRSGIRANDVRLLGGYVIEFELCA
jgi:hypothetical protein